MENRLYTPEIEAAIAELQDVNRGLLASAPIDWHTALGLNSRIFQAIMTLTGVAGALGYWEKEYGSIQALAQLPRPTPPGLGAITLPEGMTLEAFADLILPTQRANLDTDA